jgi:hypothetical protein
VRWLLLCIEPTVATIKPTHVAKVAEIGDDQRSERIAVGFDLLRMVVPIQLY